ncbi:hypothetical protein AB9M62_25305 [Bacillales bacterium AN1005]
MVIAMWIIGIIVFFVSLISFWGTVLLVLLFMGGLFGIGHFVGFDPITDLGEENFLKLVASIVGPWMLASAFVGIVRIYEFFEDIVKAVRNLADDDRK